MAPYSSTLAWKIPWTEEPGMLQSKGSRRVGHDWATSLSLFTFIIPGTAEPVGCHLWGRTELDMTEVTLQQKQQQLISV